MEGKQRPVHNPSESIFGFVSRERQAARRRTVSRETPPTQPTRVESANLPEPPRQPKPTSQQEQPAISDEYIQLARWILDRPPMSLQQLEGIKPEDYEEWARNHPYAAANYATAVRHYERAVEELAQHMKTDSLTYDYFRRKLEEEQGGSIPSEE